MAWSASVGPMQMLPCGLPKTFTRKRIDQWPVALSTQTSLGFSLQHMMFAGDVGT